MINRLAYVTFVCIASISFKIVLAQPHESPGRVATYNNIAWFGYFGDHKVHKKWSIHTEYQWRRADWGATWQQSLARIAANYHISDQAMLTAGYAHIETFPYGNYPISVGQKDGTEQSFTEHRLYQDLLLKNNMGIFEINHRFKIEERWLGTLYDGNGAIRNNEWRYFTRFRYRVRVAMPLKGATIDDKEFYLHAFDELFIGAGYNVGANIFDQNRFNIGVGYRVTKDFKIEAGFIMQYVMKPRYLSSYIPGAASTPILEYNNGFLVGVTYNIDFMKKAEVKPQPIPNQE